MLVIWEAQFGDFCNGAQVIIDQFIVSSETKWDRSSGLVMLLPHGYEGQGPEHSSGFLERFLQLCAQDNIQVCNVSTPAQYFHLLRRQMKRDFRKPLIIMTPKSLLRRGEAVSRIPEFTAGHFREVLREPTNTTGKAESVILCAGKIYYDLLEVREKLKDKSYPILRIEQFYPYPENQIETALKRYPKIKEIRWVQEETKNRGGWMFMRENLSRHIDIPLKYIGRPPKASPASGSFARHTAEQKELTEEAFS
jgi:2-oxoglutarate dehydrogenase E1 component